MNIKALFVGMKNDEVFDYLKVPGTQLAVLWFVLIAVSGALMLLLVRAARKNARTKENHHRFLHTLINTIPNPVFYKDDQGKYLGCNKAFEEMTGFSREWLVGKSVMDIVPQQLGEIYHAADQEFLRVKGVEVYESSVPYADGLFHDVIISKASFPATDGAPGGLIGTIRDITEQRKLEVQLRHSQKMEAIGTFVGGVAHDFNNILTVIIGYGNLMKLKMETDDRCRPIVEHILAAAVRAAGLTRSLLTFGRKQAIELRVVDANDVVKGVEKLLHRLLREDIDLRTTFMVEPCTVMADKGQIEQVLMNLATNARDAMNNGGILAISTSIISIDSDYIALNGYGEPGRYVLLTINDTGAGMEEDTRLRIFEPFFSTKEVGKGTGLGLSMAHGIIKQHKGYITCYSEPGNGTTFRIYLPFNNKNADSEKVEVLSELLPGGTETILLAEDDTQVRTLTRELLVRFGYTVIEAVDGTDAVMKFLIHNGSVHLALLDVIMPGKNGRAVLAEIQKIEPDMKALFTSGYPADVLQQEELSGPGLGVISKPATPGELLRAIRTLLD